MYNDMTSCYPIRLGFAFLDTGEIISQLHATPSTTSEFALFWIHVPVVILSQSIKEDFVENKKKSNLP